VRRGVGDGMPDIGAKLSNPHVALRWWRCCDVVNFSSGWRHGGQSSTIKTMKTRDLFVFPNPVNEISARGVAAGVVMMSAAAIATGSPWVIAVITYGFFARVLTGPTLSPLGQFVTRVVTPRLGLTPRYVPGPPKRFAQGIGAVLSLAALSVSVAGHVLIADLVLGMLVIAAGCESLAGFCLGCTIFAGLMRVGVIPSDVCVRCANFSAEVAVEGTH